MKTKAKTICWIAKNHSDPYNFAYEGVVGCLIITTGSGKRSRSISCVWISIGTRVAAMYGRAEEATTVHHIYPAETYPEYAWCDWNLISVSQGSHNKLENRKTGELTALGRQLMDITIPGRDWRNKA